MRRNKVMKIRDKSDKKLLLKITNKNEDRMNFVFYLDGVYLDAFELSPNGTYEILTSYFDELLK